MIHNSFDTAGSRNRIRCFFMRLVLLALVFVLTACHQEQPINVVIVTFDTTRADHIGVYGKKGANTPNLEELAKDGVVYEKALSAIPITLPSHSTIMTGKSPFVHGVRDNGIFVLSEQQLTLAEVLKQQGYKTAAAIGSFPLTSQFGINQGFDYFNEHITLKQEDVFGEKSIPKDALFFDERTATQVNDGIMPWIEKNYQDPFFVWFHYFDPHHPHEPPPPYDQHFITDLYQGEIAYSDESLGKVIAQLKRLNVYDNSLIIFTSDHGEGNGEHNEATHSLLIYNSTLHVPLIVKYPNQTHANTRIKNWVGLVDIFPTVLSILGLKNTDTSEIQGQKLPVDNSLTTHHEIYLESLSARLTRGWGEQRGLIKDGFKYIYGPQKELYDLTQDPKELQNVVEKKPELAQKMKSKLQEYLDENKPENASQTTANVSEKTLNVLRGLGYLQSTGNVSDEILEKLNDTGEAPQNHVESISFNSLAKQLLFNKQYLEAKRYIDALLETDPDNLVYLELKIQTDMILGNVQSAKQALEDLPIDFYGTLTSEKRLEILATIALKEKKLDRAKKLYLQASEINSSAMIEYELSKIAAITKDLGLQQKHLIKALDLASDENRLLFLIDLAISYAKNGDMSKAESTFIQAINEDPYYPKSHYNYGVYLKSIYDFDSSIIQFEKALALNKRLLDAYVGLYESYAFIGDSQKSNKVFENIISIAPESKQTALIQKLINQQK